MYATLERRRNTKDDKRFYRKIREADCPIVKKKYIYIYKNNNSKSHSELYISI